MISKVNKATVLLGILFTMFLALVVLKHLYPHWLWAKVQIIVEAALVGGLADWFAVTALFKKPLGFPYHTALLPRKKQAFTKATLKMIQEEFLAPKKIYSLIANLQLQPQILGFISKASTSQLTSYAANCLTAYLQQLNEKDIAKYLQEFIRAQNPKLEKLEAELNHYFLKSENEALLLDSALNYLQQYLAKPHRSAKIAAKIKNYVEEHHGGITLSLAYATDAFNPEELGDLITAYGQELIAYCQEKDGYMYQQLIPLLAEIKKDLAEEEPANSILPSHYLEELVQHPGFIVLATTLITNLKQQISGDLVDENSKIYTSLAQLMEQLKAEILTTDALQKSLVNILTKILQRIALGGEKWLLAIAEEFLNQLQPEQLNELVYPKVRQDLIWIRLNGSVVGGILGLIFMAVETLLLQ